MIYGLSRQNQSKNYEHQITNRMDGSDVESGDGLQQDQSGLSELLCRSDGAAFESDGAAGLVGDHHCCQDINL